MGGQRVHHNEEFKQRTVRWIAKYRQFENEPVNSADRIRELEQLLREKDKQVSELEQELEIVKKAVHIFSNPRK
jgi:hypothetical protein